MKKFTLLLLFAVLSITMPALASHIAGGELRYEYTGSGNAYRIYLVLYRDCSGVNLLSSETVQISSASCGLTIPLTLPMQSDDTLDHYIYCPGTLSSCYLPGSSYPGYIRRTYSDTVSLPACTDWKFSYYNCCRSATLNNIANPSNQGLYLEAFLNNSSAINSNAYTPNPLPFTTSTSSVTTYPIPAADPEGDSVVTEFITPQATSTGGNIMYSVGYSIASPLGGGVVSINNANQTIKLKGAMTGRYVLATRVKEYRNGQLIGYSSRDWAVAAFPSTSQLTIPLAASSNVQTTSTCPGQSNSITLTYNDSTITDSVYLAMVAPTIPGFTFTATGTPGIGSATTTISWTTPGTYNPATMPYFFINVFARDNACARGAAMYTVCVHGGQCAPDSVWPGDANGDFTVNVYDPLAIAVAYGQTGATRTGATTAWVAQACTPWANSFLSGANMKHADCDGNGTVNSTDLGAVTTNYGLTHPKIEIRNYAKTTGLPDLYFDATGIAFTPGQPVSIPIKLGSAGSGVNNLYGIATGIHVDGLTLAAPMTITYPTSWLGNSASTLNFTKTGNNNAIDWAYARNDHQQVSGQGAIANLNFTVPANAASGQVFHLFFQNAKLIDKNGTEITGYNIVQDTSAVLISGGVNNINHTILQASVVPNPSASNASLYLSISRPAALTIRITDITGRVVWQQAAAAGAGTMNIMLPAATIAAGMYTIQVRDNNTQELQVVKWTRE